MFVVFVSIDSVFGSRLISCIMIWFWQTACQIENSALFKNLGTFDGMLFHTTMNAHAEIN